MNETPILPSDQELLEWAAQAAGITLKWNHSIETGERGGCPYTEEEGSWNPLDFDGDALRLAVAIEIEVRVFNGKAHAGRAGEFWCTETIGGDALADTNDRMVATRRAIVRAAAAIGEQMP